MLKVETAGLSDVNVSVMALVALDRVWTMPLVHSRVHKKPAVKRRTAVSMDRLWEYSHSVLLFED